MRASAARPRTAAPVNFAIGRAASDDPASFGLARLRRRLFVEGLAGPRGGLEGLSIRGGEDAIAPRGELAVTERAGVGGV